MRQAGVMTLNHGEGDRLTGTEIQGLDKLGVKIKKFEKQNKKKPNKNTRVNDLHHVLNSFLYDFYMFHSTGGHCFLMCCILEKSFVFNFFILYLFNEDCQQPMATSGLFYVLFL